MAPRYYDQGISAFWLDETDGEGTTTGSKHSNDLNGYNTSFGPAAAFTNLWVGSWIRTFSEPVATLGQHRPLVLVRGAWAGAQRYGIVLWSSDIWSTFETLASQVPQGVHASMSGIPWWTTDVGGYGCGHNPPLCCAKNPDNHSPYMQELIVRWYQFGVFCPVFRSHGCRWCAAASCQEEPDVAPCVGVASSCAANEVWSYGNETQAKLEKLVRFRATMKRYLAELAANVTRDGVPTMRPLAFEFPEDRGSTAINDQYMLGPSYLVAPVTVQGATTRRMYFPAGTAWTSIWDSSDVVQGGVMRTVAAPIDTIPVYRRGGAAGW